MLHDTYLLTYTENPYLLTQKIQTTKPNETETLKTLSSCLIFHLLRKWIVQLLHGLC